jgi:hypothetical protein
MRRAASWTFFLVCIVISVGGLINVVGDNSEVERLAAEVACGTTPCKAEWRRVQRNPLAQTFDMATPKGTVTVRCARSWIVFGEYACTR